LERGFFAGGAYAIAGTIATCLVIAYRKSAARRAALDEEQTID